ncbi:MAG: hypothetical protein QXI89_00705 [Candidatus Anstonellales archaeon]
MLFNLFTIHFGSYVYQNIYFTYDGTALYATSENGNIYSITNLSANALAFIKNKAYAGGDGSIGLYYLSAIPVSNTSITINGSAISMAVSNNSLYVLTLDKDERSQRLLYSLNLYDENGNPIDSLVLDRVADFIRPASNGVFLYSNAGISLITSENNKLKEQMLFPLIKSKSNVGENLYGYIAGSLTGLVLLVNKNGETISSVNLDGSVQAISSSGNEARVLTNKAYYVLQLPNMNIVNKYEIKETTALFTTLEGDKIIAFYPTSVVVFSDRPRQSYSIDGYSLSYAIKENNLLLLYLKNFRKSFLKIDISKGCYIKSFPNEAGFIPFSIEGYSWPLNQQITIRANNLFYATQADNFGAFSLLIDPKNFDRDMNISCSTQGSQQEIIKIKKNDKLPKDKFLLEPDITKVDKGSVIRFMVKDIAGLEVSDYNLSVNGQTSKITRPFFTIVFDKEGQYNIEIAKDGFETYRKTIEVPSIPILAIVILLIIVALALIYYIMSKI